MSSFYDSIKNEVEDALAADFGVSYDSDPTVLKRVQTEINAMGYSPPLVVDGAYGPKTKAGIQWAQSQKGITPDGVVGPQTLAALGLSASAGGTPSKGGSSPKVDHSEFAPLVAFAAKYPQGITQASGIAPGFSGTRASVVESFVDWSKPFEGYTNYPYTDAHGLITTGMGNMIDSGSVGGACGAGTSTPCGSPTPTAAARALPWSPNNIDADWAALKAAWPKVQSTAGQSLTSSRLSKDAIVSLVSEKMKANDQYIMAHLPSFAHAPADAQLAVHSMSWAMGPAFTGSWTGFRTAFEAGDYASAAAQSHMQGVGIDMRNMANKLLLLNAATVKALGVNYDHLYYLDGLALQAGGFMTRIWLNAKAHPVRTAAIVTAVGTGLAALLGHVSK